MDQKELIRKMGRFPDKINPPKRLTSKSWQCSKCEKIYNSETERANPAPCSGCDSIFFRATKCQERKILTACDKFEGAIMEYGLDNALEYFATPEESHHLFSHLINFQTTGKI